METFSCINCTKSYVKLLFYAKKILFNVEICNSYSTSICYKNGLKCIIIAFNEEITFKIL